MANIEKMRGQFRTMGAIYAWDRELATCVPEYYRWRSRSGCYFCFFQRPDEWLGLADNHPELFERAQTYEKTDSATGKRFTWVQGRSLDEVLDDRRRIEAAAANSRKVCQPVEEVCSLSRLFRYR